MAGRLPLLVFPRAKRVTPPKGGGFTPSKPHVPGHERQAERLRKQLTELRDDFARYRASVSGVLASMEPETVLVIEIAGSLDKFRQAVENTDGLEWQGEWDIEAIQPDEDFYEPPKIGVDFFKKRIDQVDKEQSKEIRHLLQEQDFIDKRGNLIADDLSGLRLPEHLEYLRQEIVQAIDREKEKPISGKLFISLVNQRGLDELLKLWHRWDKNEDLPDGKKKWRDLFTQTRRIRRWGIEETLGETGMIERWRELLNPIDPAREIHCQIELFYRQKPSKRRENEDALRSLLGEIEGGTLGRFLDMEEIAFHAVKARLPAEHVRRLLAMLDSDSGEIDIQLFRFRGVMYFRPTGQSLVAAGDEAGTERAFPEGAPELPPVAAILDGAPNLQHDALKDRLLFDDPDNLSARYQPGERRHGTAMASLVVHGELDDGQADPLPSAVYCLPVMEPNVNERNRGEYVEHFPDDVFFEDRIERAVRRMLEGEGDAPAQAPGIKVINLSIGDPERPFIHTPSPWARLLDWLAWKHRVLFCVSAGNYTGDIDVGMAHGQFTALPNDRKIEQYLKGIERQLSQRRLLSPAESLNALTIGAMHADSSGEYVAGRRIDLLPDDLLPNDLFPNDQLLNDGLFSPVSRFGHGFRRSVKPEILFQGGRQLYHEPPLDEEQRLSPDAGLRAPGQCVAWDSAEGALSKTVFSRGTSNATALATRGAARIYEVLIDLKDEFDERIPDELISLLLKTLLVHGAYHGENVKQALTSAFKNKDNSRHFKEIMARYIGYGPVGIERVLACTEQRATVLGSGEIRENEAHEYQFPLPIGLSSRADWRRMLVTLAWFTPINPRHRNLREAKLAFQPVGKWDELPLKLERVDADHNQVSRGTVQHEVLEGKKQISPYGEDGHIRLQVRCKADTTENLDQKVPYGLAVTLEVAEGIGVPIYEQVRARIRPQVSVRATGGNR